MRSIGASASKGSHAAPLIAMPIWAIRSSGPRAIHRPTTSPAPMPRAASAAPMARARASTSRIGEGAARPDEGRLLGMSHCRSGENLGQDLVAKEIGALRSAQHGRSRLGEHGIFGKDAPIHRVHRRPFRLGAFALAPAPSFAIRFRTALELPRGTRSDAGRESGNGAFGGRPSRSRCSAAAHRPAGSSLRGQRLTSHEREPLKSSPASIITDVTGASPPSLGWRALDGEACRRLGYPKREGRIPMNDAEFAKIASWIAESGLAGISEKAMLAGFCERLRAAGVPIARASLFVDTLHPTYEGRLFHWRSGEGARPPVDYPRTRDADQLAELATKPLLPLDRDGRLALASEGARGADAGTCDLHRAQGSRHDASSSR